MKSEEYSFLDKIGFINNDIYEKQMIEDFKDNLELKDNEYNEMFKEQFFKPELENNVYFVDKHETVKKVYLFPWQKALLTNYYLKSNTKDAIDNKNGFRDVYIVNDKEDIEFVLKDLKVDLGDIDPLYRELCYTDVAENLKTKVFDMNHLTPFGLEDIINFPTRALVGVFKEEFLAINEKDGYPQLRNDLFVDDDKFHLCIANFVDWKKFLDDKKSSKSTINSNTNSYMKKNNSKDIYLKMKTKDIINKDGFNYIFISENQCVKINEKNFRIINGDYTLQTKSEYKHSIYNKDMKTYIDKISVDDLKNMLNKQVDKNKEK